jgi:hypothetical protein
MTQPNTDLERFPQPPPGHRDWYSFEAIRALPRIVLMVDKNPFSKTYGCFDREYWHYRTVDFPCGMNQEFCLPLALAATQPFPHNPYYGNQRLRELAVAAIEFARKASHADGSCDDYFPFERALGALVFSTYAMTESYKLLGLDRPDLLEFFRLRGDWLRKHNESGQLANHQALAALSLYNVYGLTGDPTYREASNHFRDITLAWQKSEGWFQEYEGADPGYHSCTIAFLGKLRQKSGDESLLEPLRRAADFASYFMHPDGSYAGEYGSRNTYHFYPHGFELLAPHSPAAARIAQTYLERALPERRRYYNDDNRMCAHYIYDWMQSWLDYHPKRLGTIDDERGEFQRLFPDAKLFVKKTKNYYAVLSLAKGGVLKVFDRNGPLFSDTGLMLESESGDVYVSHMVGDYELEVDVQKGEFSVSGKLCRRKQHLSSPTKQMAFRAMNLSVGRGNADLVRRTLQKILIVGKPFTEIGFRREVRFEEDRISIVDSLDASKTSERYRRLVTGSDATSIYVANSNTFQESVLEPWTDLSEHVAALNQRRHLVLPERIAKGRASG